MNLAGNLVRSADEFPGRPAVRPHDTVLTYADLDRRSAAVAALLAARGVRPGDRIAVMLPNVPEFAVAYYAILRAGAVVRSAHRRSAESSSGEDPPAQGSASARRGGDSAAPLRKLSWPRTRHRGTVRPAARRGRRHTPGVAGRCARA